MIFIIKIVISSMPEHSDELWRDFSGFIVADKHRLAEFEIET
jgi:hypothetical protein